MTELENLLKSYSLGELILLLGAFAIIFKKVIQYIDWLTKRIKNKFSQQEKSHGVQQQIAKLTEAVTEISDKVNTLIESDKDDIKSFLTKEHHYFCYRKHWIDDYSLDCCQKRYKHYVKEGGNSFIEGFMNQLRNLPKRPPES